MKFFYHVFVTVCAVFISVVLTGCGTSVELPSARLSQPVVIDGDDADWQATPVYFDKQKFSLGFSNDERSLFVVFSTADRQLMGRVLMGGLTVWFDAVGAEQKLYGVRFPLSRRERMQQGDLAGRDWARGNGDQQDTNRIARMLENANGQMEIIGPDPEQKRTVLLPASEGYAATVDVKGGKLVYEVQVPLPPAAATGATIDVGLETGQMTFRRDGSGGMSPEGGMHPGGGPPPGMGGTGGHQPGMGPGMREMRQQRSDGLDVWLQVRVNEK